MDNSFASHAYSFSKMAFEYRPFVVFTSNNSIHVIVEKFRQACLFVAHIRKFHYGQKLTLCLKIFSHVDIMKND